MEKPANKSEDSVHVRYQPRDSQAQDEDSFIIKEELQKTDKKVHDHVYAVLSAAKPGSDLPVPIYRTSWRHIVAPENAGLQESVILYQRLEEFILSKGAKSVIYEENLKKRHILVVKDVAKQHGVEVIGKGYDGFSKLHMLWRFLKNSFLVLPFLFDEGVSLLLNYFESKPAKTEIAFIPSLGRLESTLPVLDKLKQSDYEDYSVIITSKVSTRWRNWVWKYKRSKLDNHLLHPLSSFVSFQLIIRQIWAYIEVSNSIFFGGKLKKELNTLIESEFDANLSRTLDHAIYESFRTRVFLSIFFYTLTESMVDRTDSEKVVIGGLSPSRRAIMLAGMNKNADVYYIPHNIGTAGTPNPPSELTHFVSGKLEKRRYSESDQVPESWNWIVTGRPYLVEMYNRHQNRGKLTEGGNSGLRILIATQGYFCRQEFVAKVIEGVEKAELDAHIVIKTHPSEETDEYSTFADAVDYVSVTDTDLFKHIDEADLTVTMNSNVGLESVIAGTPTVCVNMWEPTIPDPIYSMYGPIPVIRNMEEITNLFEKFDTEFLTELWESENKFVHEYFELEADAAENIKDVIMS